MGADVTPKDMDADQPSTQHNSVSRIDSADTQTCLLDEKSHTKQQVAALSDPKSPAVIYIISSVSISLISVVLEG